METNTQLNARIAEDGGLVSRALSRVGRVLLTCGLTVSGMGFTAPAFGDEVIEEQVVTGVRGKPRTVQDSPVPIDVFGEQAINDVAFTDMNDILRTLVPSYGVRRQPISDGADLHSPCNDAWSADG